ncbi:MAG: hypothetical protein WBW71_04165 [Bacteroidota bacterium]
MRRILGIGGHVRRSDACVEKTAGKQEGHVRTVFSGSCVGRHRVGSDSEKLFPLSKNMKGGIPYGGTLLLSLAAEKEV